MSKALLCGMWWLHTCHDARMPIGPRHAVVVQVQGASVFAENTARFGFGGAIHADSASLLVLINTTLTRNTAESGGGIYVASANGSVVVVSGGEWSFNSALGNYRLSTQLVRIQPPSCPTCSILPCTCFLKHQIKS